ncbi:GNAT family N-acetyltransferase [Candidatus Bathyarchaeota archaeon]|nr:GNAT family N-acetyltransferase [Candidatus Bathyarchaeota archaeon]
MTIKSDSHAKCFILKDKRCVVLRPPVMEDLDGLLELNQSAVAEDLDIEQVIELSRGEATALLQDMMARMAEKEALDLIAIVDSRIVANATIIRMKGLSHHIGEYGNGIMEGYRGIGVGTAMLQELIPSSRKIGLKVLISRTFASNIGARKMLERCSFKEVACIPKFYERKGKYIDEIIAALEL